MPKYSSDKKKIKPFSGLGSDRYRYLSLEEAEPNLGFTTEKQLPIKNQYYQLVTFDGGTLADRYWQVAPVGVITGISIYNDGILVSIGNSINKLDFRGNIIDASASGTISTITVSSPGNENEIIYSGRDGDFNASSKLIFNSNVGILTVSDGLNVGIGGSYLTVTPLGLIGINTNNPTQELHISGDIRLTGTIYDQNNNPGNATDVLIKNSLGGLIWITQGSIRSGAGGTYTNIQYHNSAGLVDGASNFVYNPSNNRVGIGSTIPQQLLDVLGYSRFTGQTDINILNVSGVGTVSKLDVNNLTTLKDLKVVGFSTFDQYIDANNGAYIDNIRIGIANDNEIDTSTGNLTLDSAGGTTNIDDNLIISGSATINSTTQSTTKDTGALIVEGGVGVEKNANIGGTLSVTGTSNLQGILTVGNDILPTVTNTQYLGSSSLKWDRVYANVIEGNITGNAASATKLFTSRNFSVSGDTSAPAVSFDGTANVDLVTTLANSGVTAGTYGSAIQVGIVTVDSKGRVTSASNIGINFSTATVAQSDTVKTIATATNASFYPTFVDSNNPTAAYESVYTDGGISYNPSTDLLSLTNVIVSGTSTFNGNVTLGDATSDTVSFTSRVNTSILPSTNGTLDLGGTSNKWNNIYANTFVGAITGNADTATALANSRNFSISGDVDAPSVSFNGTGNVNLVTTLDNTGVVANTYGSSTTVPVFAVDAKGRVTSASNIGINFSTATVAQADKLTNSRNIAITGDLSWNVNFDGSTNVTATGTLANSGVSANTYGSSTTVPVFAVDAKGRVTSVTNTGINFSTATVAQADTVKTVASSSSLLYPTFVDSNNSPAAYESLYTDDGISYNASTNLLTVSNIKPSGIQDSSGTTGTNNYVLTANGSGGWTWKIASTSGGSAAIGGITIQEEGTLVGSALGTQILNFIGGSVTATSPTSGTATITVIPKTSDGTTIDSIQSTANSATTAAAAAQSTANSATTAAAAAQSTANSATTAAAAAQSTANSAVSGLSNLNASNLTSGTIPDARFPATLPAISGANLTNLPGAFPSGTLMLFQQTTAPTGWTKQTTHNNKALRVVSGTAGSGGSTAFTTVFASRTPTGSVSGTNSSGSVTATTLATSQIPSHVHSGGALWPGSGPEQDQSGGPENRTTFNINTGSTGGGGSHTHGFTNPTWTGTFTGTAMDFDVQYVDLIIASKN